VFSSGCSTSFDVDKGEPGDVYAGKTGCANDMLGSLTRRLAMLCKRRSTYPYTLEAIEVEGGHPAAAGVAQAKHGRLCRWDAGLARDRRPPHHRPSPAEPRQPDRQLILDTTTALFAIAAHGDEREAHIREVQRYGENPARLLRPTQPPGHRPDLGQDSAASDDAGL